MGLGHITDVPGVRVGHHHRNGRGWRTGTTVVRFDGGAIASCDVRGGGPGTRETDLLHPTAMIARRQAICLSGGSAYGLAAAHGVMRWHEEIRTGFDDLPAEWWKGLEEQGLLSDDGVVVATWNNLEGRTQEQVVALVGQDDLS